MVRVASDVYGRIWRSPLGLRHYRWEVREGDEPARLLKTYGRAFTRDGARRAAWRVICRARGDIIAEAERREEYRRTIETITAEP